MPRALAFIAVLLVGASLRFIGLNWDERQHLHPDERFLTMVMVAERWPSSFGEYLDEARSPLNPRNVGFRSFAYGTLPTTIVKGLGIASGRSGYDEIVLVGRVASAAADLGSLIFLVLLAQRLYGDHRIALLAGGFYATTVLSIQLSHFFVVDTFATFFVTATLWAIAGAARSSLRPYLLGGAFLGLALACKLSIWPLAIVIAGVALHAEGLRGYRAAAVRLAAAGAAALIAFRIGSPDVFNGWHMLGVAPSPRWMANLKETVQLMSGAIDFPPGVQWADRPALIFSLDNIVRWNLGPFLGVTTSVATGAALWRLGANRHYVHLLPVSWILLVFLPQSTQFVKAGRYMLPIFPVMALLAAWLLIRMWDRTSIPSRRSGWQRLVAVTTLAVVCVGTLGWALAFTSIYRRPNTRVEASRWIYEHVPAGSVLATEYWDDALPLRMGSLAPERYPGIQLANYDDDTPAKLETLMKSLDAVHYVILSSNRLAESIPRLPMRYPMTTRYYQELFSGRLGFDRVADFTSHPTIVGLQVPDQSAEEAFTVYDHARVQIFRKSDRWNTAEAFRLLNEGVDWEGIVRVIPARASSYHNGQLFTPGDFDQVRHSGTWSRLFDTGSFVNRHPLLIWCLLLELLGLMAFPITTTAFRELWDRGWLISKAIGLLIVGYLAWLISSLRWLPFEQSTLVLIAIAVGTAGGWWAWRHRADYVEFWRTQRRVVAGEELLFWIAFGVLLIVRSGNPDLWHPVFGGEKPMDFAYLNAVTRSSHFPPYDPWFAGGYINYYYFGFVLVATVSKLTGIVPAVAYNLAFPTLFAFTVAGVFTVVSTFVAAVASTGKRAAPVVFGGLLGVLLVTVLGNFAEAGMLLDPASSQLPNWTWYWNATRVIPFAQGEAPPITEFPFFTFLYGDLHAHLLALPYTLVALSAATALALPSTQEGYRGVRLSAFALLGLVIGALYATNTWDYPTYLAIAGATLAFREWHAQTPRLAFGRVFFLTAFRVLVLVVIGRLLFAPFLAHYGQAYGNIAWWSGSHTTLRSYLLIHGLFVFTLGVAVSWWVAMRPRGPGRIVFTPCMLLLIVLAATGLALSLAVEVVVMANDISRMNTVFKFYFQAWVVWGVASAIAATLLVDRWITFPLRGARRFIAGTCAAVFVALVFAGAVYPVVATRARWTDRFDRATGFTLDGRAYMRTASHVEQERTFPLAPDLEAIEWLERETAGTPVIVEAHTSEYHWGARIATNTGLPTILGWQWHQQQQRAVMPADVVTRRIGHIEEIYKSPDIDRVTAILNRYRVEYVYVGALERIWYPADGLSKFDNHPDRWRRVYRNSDVSIYKVIR